MLSVVITLVAVLQEARGYSPSVRPERRRQLEEEIANSSPMALEVLTSCLSQPGERILSLTRPHKTAAGQTLQPVAGPLQYRLALWIFICCRCRRYELATHVFLFPEPSFRLQPMLAQPVCPIAIPSV